VELPARTRAYDALLVFAVVASLCVTAPAKAAGRQGDFLQTDTLGVGLVTRDMTAHTTRTVSDATNLSEYVGLHYYALDRVRFGMNLQLTERLRPEPPKAQGSVQRFAFLPQVGWNFYDPFFAALVLVVAPRSDGQSKVALGMNGIVGAAFPITKHVSISAALEVPYNYYHHQTIGLTALSGIGIRF
jgi:hypothetical protein